jgi:hypothetical protein
MILGDNNSKKISLATGSMDLLFFWSETSEQSTVHIIKRNSTVTSGSSLEIYGRLAALINIGPRNKK